MRQSRMGIACLLLVAGASLARGQQPGGTPMPPQGRAQHGGEMGHEDEMHGMGPGSHHMGPMHGPEGGLAAMMLAQTGELKLTDQQVTRLAAIARRGADRHRAMRGSLDSLMQAEHARVGTGGQTMAPHAMPEAARAMMQRAHDDERGDVRDALSVLSIDQLTDAVMLLHEHMGQAMTMMHQMAPHPVTPRG